MTGKDKESRRSIGFYYEEKAVEYLKKKGYRIVKRNYYCRQGEIDIIAEDHSCLVFLEVRYRGNTGSGLPEESVSLTKMRRIIAAARYYLYTHGYSDEVFCRFDVIGVSDNTIRHYINAFDGQGNVALCEKETYQF